MTIGGLVISLASSYDGLQGLINEHRLLPRGVELSSPRTLLEATYPMAPTAETLNAILSRKILTSNRRPKHTK